jgi:type IV secretory pathway TrbF-like protein
MKTSLPKPWHALTEEEKAAYRSAEVGDLSAADPDTYARVHYENSRRDGKAEWREWRAYRVAAGASLAVIILALGLVWFAIRGSRVDVVVQVVQHDEDGRLVKIGIPMDLLDYQPQEGAWRDMLAEWVNKKNSRDDAPSEVRARQDWRWLYLHTCGKVARKQLAEAEKKEQPFNRNIGKTVKVDVDSVTKTVSPESYQVLWRATTLEKHSPSAEELWWTTTFNVGRVSPKSRADATSNHLGLCVTWFDDDKSPGKKLH